MAKAEITIHLADMPEVLAAMRAEAARVIRKQAEDEHPLVAIRLRAIAAQFEAGVVDV